MTAVVSAMGMHTEKATGHRVRLFAAVLLVPAMGLSLGACSGADQRTGVLTGVGAVGGAIIGGAVGGTRGAIAGAAIGGAAGLVTGLLLDAIEQEQARQAAIAAARSGSDTRSFRNSKGDNVRIASRTTRRYEQGGTRYREVTRTVTRNGQKVGEEKATVKEVKLANGKTDFAVEG
jgi:hypothetical protein